MTKARHIMKKLAQTGGEGQTPASIAQTANKNNTPIQPLWKPPKVESPKPEQTMKPVNQATSVPETKPADLPDPNNPEAKKQLNKTGSSRKAKEYPAPIKQTPSPHLF